MKRIDPRNPKRTQSNHKQNIPKNETEPVVQEGKKRK